MATKEKLFIPPGVEPGTRPANTVGSKTTGGINGTRVGNTPTTNVDIDEAPQRHTAGGKAVKTSENLPVRESGKKANGK